MDSFFVWMFKFLDSRWSNAQKGKIMIGRIFLKNVTSPIEMFFFHSQTRNSNQLDYIIIYKFIWNLKKNQIALSNWKWQSNLEFHAWMKTMKQLQESFLKCDQAMKKCTVEKTGSCKKYFLKTFSWKLVKPGGYTCINLYA